MLSPDEIIHLIKETLKNGLPPLIEDDRTVSDLDNASAAQSPCPQDSSQSGASPEQ